MKEIFKKYLSSVEYEDILKMPYTRGSPKYLEFLLENNYESFYNPHRSGTPYCSNGIDIIISSWLYRNSSFVDSVIKNIKQVVFELIVNIQENNNDSFKVESLLISSLDSKYFNLSILDNGTDFFSSVQNKLANIELEEEDFLKNILLGKFIGKLGRGKGFGLPDLFKLIKSINRSELLIATGKFQLEYKNNYIKQDVTNIAGNIIKIKLPVGK